MLWKWRSHHQETLGRPDLPSWRPWRSSHHHLLADHFYLSFKSTCFDLKTFLSKSHSLNVSIKIIDACLMPVEAEKEDMRTQFYNVKRYTIIIDNKNKYLFQFFWSSSEKTYMSTVHFINNAVFSSMPYPIGHRESYWFFFSYNALVFNYYLKHVLYFFVSSNDQVSAVLSYNLNHSFQCSENKQTNTDTVMNSWIHW